MSGPLNHQTMPMVPPQGQPDNLLPPDFVHPQPQGLVQPLAFMCPPLVPCCQLHPQFPQLVMLMLMHMQTQGCTCAAHLATMILSNQARAPPPRPPPPTGTSDTNSRDSQLLQPSSAAVLNAHTVSSSIHMPNLTPGPVPNIPMASSGIPMPNSTPTPGPSPAHSQPDPLFMANNNMHIGAQQYGAQQYASSQHLAFAAANLRNTTQNPAQGPASYLQCLQGNFLTLSSNPLLPSTHNLHLKNHQILPPHVSIASVASHNNPQAMPLLPSPCSYSALPMPPHPLHNLTLPVQHTSVPNGVISNPPTFNARHNGIVADGHVQNQCQIPSQLIPSHSSHPLLMPEQTHLISPPLPSDPHPSVLSKPTFPSNTASTTQTLATPPFMCQNVAEMSQMGATHLSSNTALQGVLSITSHQDPQHMHQAQQKRQPGSLQPSEGSSSEQGFSNKNSSGLNDVSQSQKGACSRAFSLAASCRGQASGYSVHANGDGGRLNMNEARRNEGQRKSDREAKTEASEPNFSGHAQGRSKGGFPTASYSPNRGFNKGPSRLQKDATGGTSHGRSHGAVLFCKRCDRSFTHRWHLQEHFNSHHKCDEENCMFEASGRVLKEHKLSQDGKQNGQASPAIQGDALPQSEKSMDDIRQWREERKKNYPTEANIQRKAQVMRERKARGELIDEDANKRWQRMTEIFAKQAELGVSVPESYCIMNQRNYHKQPRENGLHGHLQQDSDTSRKVLIDGGSFVKGKRSHPDENDERKQLAVAGSSPLKIPRLEDLTSPRSVLNDVNSFKENQSGEAIGPVKPADEIQCSEGPALTAVLKRIDDVDKTEGLSNTCSNATAEDRRLQYGKGKKSKKGQAVCRYFRRGRCLNGECCKYLHVRESDDSQKHTSVVSEPSKRKPTLLEKLLSGEIRKEKSHLLQVFRFMVNNAFFTEWPEKPLKFLQWSTEAVSTDPERAERRYLSYLGSNYGIGEERGNLDNGDVIKKIAGGEGESGCGDGDDIEEGEIEEGEIQ